MKLINLLLKTNIKWPEGARYIYQDHFQDIKTDQGEVILARAEPTTSCQVVPLRIFKIRKSREPLTVDVSSCTPEERILVMQAFHDLGYEWRSKLGPFPYMKAKTYTNTMVGQELAYQENFLMWNDELEGVTHTFEEFITTVYGEK